MAHAQEKAALTTEDMIRQAFGDKANQALKVARCESGLVPNARSKTSTATGVFQILKGTWQANTNEPWSKVSDAPTNIMVAKKLYDNRGWQPWKASIKCHGYK